MAAKKSPRHPTRIIPPTSVSRIFIALIEKKIMIRLAIHLKGKERLFDVSQFEEMAAFLAPALARGVPITASSSVDWPEDGGFPKNFKARAYLTRVVERARQMTAVQVKVTTLSKAGKAIETAVKGRSTPITVKFAESGKKGEDVYLTFGEDNDLQYFLSGLRYGARLALLK